MSQNTFPHPAIMELTAPCKARGAACFQDILETWISEAIDAKDYARCRAICDLYWQLWFADNEERKAAA